MCGNPEMHVTVCGMPLLRYNELFDGVLQGTFGELTEEELAAGWHFCGSFDGLLLHPDSDKEYACCRCNGSITRAFAKAARIAVRTKTMHDVSCRISELHRIFSTVDDELLDKDRESMSVEFDELEIYHTELARDMREDMGLDH